jgi:hypothetical protein
VVLHRKKQDLFLKEKFGNVAGVIYRPCLDADLALRAIARFVF